MRRPGSVKKVVVAVRGGVAEVARCPRGVVVEIRDYDTEGCDPDALSEDKALVGVWGSHDTGKAAKPAAMAMGKAPGNFVVEWSIDICADTFRQAAEEALAIQRNPESTATVFEVICPATGVRQTVDLQEVPAPDAYRCRVCGDRVTAADTRLHLCGHNPNADGMDWEAIRDEFVLCE